ncbi:MAG TPA: thioredoxin domain-containing protein [Dermatophilaceae bacterium]|nr:thioredoxin domain-containing protein [Dermatophilaceae bacterium]
MTNRLAGATSPYLLQHAENPVDWWEWGPESFEEAKRRDAPILLSVGYAACHWCHVMAHESFEDQTVAAVLNRDFVAIKVDREERPDIDAVYMQATQAMTGRGGWPMTCVLTPEGDPFFAGTYLPRDAFLQLLDAVTATWAQQRSRVVDHGARVAATLRRAGADGTPVGVDAVFLDAAHDRLAGSFDAPRGGFGGAPKFPPSMVLVWLLRQHHRTKSAPTWQMIDTTCTAMARGGMYDQLAGGFARYSVDADWVVPHFEKMLYDNAQLLSVYLQWWRAGGGDLAARVAAETADFILRDLGTPEGGLASALDADTAGVEGLTYAWTPRQLREALGDADGDAAARLLSVTDAGTFEHGTSTLQLRSDPSGPDGAAWWAGVRQRLLLARSRRPQPPRDDKVVTAWNGLAIAALAEAGALLAEPRYLIGARDAAELICDRHIVGGRLRRASLGGAVSEAAGVAEDYGNLALGLAKLTQATGDPSWLQTAHGLLDVALAHFRAEDGGFFDTPDDGEHLFLRPRTETDNAEPSGQSALAAGLVEVGALTGNADYLMVAAAAVRAAARVAGAAPRFGGWALAVAEAQLAGPVQVAIVHPEREPDPAAWALVDVSRRSGSAGLVLAHGRPDTPGVPLLTGRPLVGGRSAAYVCRGFVCDRPVTDPDVLARALSSGTG